MPARSPERVLLGLIGAGIQASRAPELHEAAGAAVGRRLFYQLSAVSRPGPDIGVMRAAMGTDTR
jgi:shikimate dehydrogenase